MHEIQRLRALRQLIKDQADTAIRQNVNQDASRAAKLVALPFIDLTIDGLKSGQTLCDAVGDIMHVMGNVAGSMTDNVTLQNRFELLTHAAAEFGRGGMVGAYPHTRQDHANVTPMQRVKAGARVL